MGFLSDPNAKTIEECEYVVHRHKLNKNQLRDLLDRPFFDKEAVLETLEDGPTIVTELKHKSKQKMIATQLKQIGLKY